MKKIVDGIEFEVSVDESIDINSEWESNLNFRNSIDYQFKRQQEYPSFADQLDYMFNNGFDGWKTMIQAIKDKYPKPNI